MNSLKAVKQPPLSLVRRDKFFRKAATIATNAQGWILGPAFLLYAGANFLKNQSPNNNSTFFKFASDPVSINFLLDGLSTIAEYSGGFSLVGNLLRFFNDILLLIPKDNQENKNPVLNLINNFTDKGLSAVYLLASSMTGVSWAFDANSTLTKELNSKQGLMNKLELQTKYFINYIKELPSKFTDKKLLAEKFRQIRQKPLETIGQGTKHGILLHSLLALISLPFIVIGLLSPKPDTSQKNTEQIASTPQKENKTQEDNLFSKIGWFLAGFSRIPLVVSIFASTFNTDLRKRYGIFYSVLSFIYDGLLVVRTIFPASILGDAINNFVSTLRSFLSRKGRNNLNET